MASKVAIEVAARNTASDEIKKLSADCKASFEQIQNQAGSVTSSVSKITSAFGALAAIAAGGAGLKGAIDATVNYTKENTNLARVLGITTDQASILKEALKESFIDSDVYINAIQKLTMRLKDGGKTFEEYGINIRKANGELKQPQKMLGDVVAKINTMTSTTERNRAMAEMFGKGWTEVLKILQLTPQAFTEAREKLENLNLILGKDSEEAVKVYRKSMVDLDTTVEALKINLGVALIPSLTKVSTWFASVGPTVINNIVPIFMKVADVLSYTSVQLGILAYAFDKILLATLINAGTAVVAWVQTIQVQMALASMAWTTGPAVSQVSALTSAITSSINPWVLVGAVAIGAGVAIERFITADSRAAQLTIDHEKKNVQLITSFQNLSKEAQGYQDIIDSKKSTEAERIRAKENLKIAIEQLNKIYPDFNKLLFDETGQQVKLSEAIEKANKAKSETLRLDVVRLQQEKQQLQNEMDKLGKTINPSSYSPNLYQNDSAAMADKAKAIKMKDDAIQIAQDGIIGINNALDYKPVKDNLPSTEKASNMLKFDNALSNEKLKIEQEAVKTGQDSIWVKEQESQWIKINLSQFKLTNDEKTRLKIKANDLDIQIIKDKESRDKKNTEETIKETAKLYQNESVILTNTQNEKEKFAERNYELGNITKVQQLQLEQECEDERYRIELEYYDKLEKLYKNDKVKFEQVEVQKSALVGEHSQKTTVNKNKLDDAVGLTTFSGGMNKFITESKRSMENWKSTIINNVLRGVENSFSNFFSSIFKSGMTGAQKWNALWKGMADATVSALAQMASQYLVLHGVQIVMSLLGKTETPLKIAQLATETEATQALALAAVDLATSETWAAYAMIPFVGAGLAMAQIGIMEGSLLAAHAAAMTTKATGMAIGGLVTRPQLTMLGEGGEPELVAPQSSFNDWVKGMAGFAGSIAYGIGKQDRMNSNYSEMSSSYAQSARSNSFSKGNGPVFHGPVIVGKDAQNWLDEQVYNANKRNGYFGG